MQLAGPSSVPASSGALLKQVTPAKTPKVGRRNPVQLSVSAPVRPPAKSPNTSNKADRKQLQRKWFSKHAEKIGMQKRENERLIQKLQDRINRAASGAAEENVTEDLGTGGGSLLAPISTGSLSQATTGTAPLVILERKLHEARKQQRELESQDLTRIEVGECPRPFVIPSWNMSCPCACKCT